MRNAKQGERRPRTKCEMHVDEQLSDGNGLGVEKFMILARLMEL